MNDRSLRPSGHMYRRSRLREMLTPLRGRPSRRVGVLPLRSRAVIATCSEYTSTGGTVDCTLALRPRLARPIGGCEPGPQQARSGQPVGLNGKRGLELS